MDYLKVFDESQEKLQKKVKVVEDTSSAVGMELGLKKCAVARIVGGKVVQGGSLPLATGAAIEEVKYGSTYRYLGVHQLFGAKLAKTKQRIVMEYVGRLRKTWGNRLNSKNAVKASNSWAAAVFRYFFGVLKWSKRDLVGMDRKTRKIMRQNKAHHNSASLERLYLPRAEGGRGLTIEWETEAVTSTLYLARCPDPQVRGAMAMQKFLMEVDRYSYLQRAQEVLNRYELGYSLTIDSDDLPVPKTVHQQLKETPDVARQVESQGTPRSLHKSDSRSRLRSESHPRMAK